MDVKYVTGTSTTITTGLTDIGRPTALQWLLTARGGGRAYFRSVGEPFQRTVGGGPEQTPLLVALMVAVIGSSAATMIALSRGKMKA